MSAKNLFEQLLRLVQPTKLGFVVCLAQRLEGNLNSSMEVWSCHSLCILLDAESWHSQQQKSQSVCGTYLFGPSNWKSNLVSGQVACLVYSEMLRSVPVTSCDILGMV